MEILEASSAWRTNSVELQMGARLLSSSRSSRGWQQNCLDRSRERAWKSLQNQLLNPCEFPVPFPFFDSLSKVLWRCRYTVPTLFPPIKQNWVTTQTRSSFSLLKPNHTNLPVRTLRRGTTTRQAVFWKMASQGVETEETREYARLAKCTNCEDSGVVFEDLPQKGVLRFRVFKIKKAVFTQYYCKFLLTTWQLKFWVCEIVRKELKSYIGAEKQRLIQKRKILRTLLSILFISPLFSLISSPFFLCPSFPCLTSYHLALSCLVARFSREQLGSKSGRADHPVFVCQHLPRHLMRNGSLKLIPVG